jgi:hypothetical protein
MTLAPDEALGRLAHRYLAGHGPAEPPDLAKWAGISLGAARRGFAAAGEEAGASRRRVRLPPPRLLGPFDPLLHGWASRAPFVGDHSGVVTTNGIFRPVALVEGHVVATWRLAGGVLTIDYLERVPAAAHTALVEDGAAVLRFLGLPDRPVVVG